mmetsp:Transcript_7054/g.20489  ORF Transcript_7054/g.20489 Transcript_7054/m.20489 type:complete len:201 (+) Transcript_7054:3090-3692(+)
MVDVVFFPFDLGEVTVLVKMLLDQVVEIRWDFHFGISMFCEIVNRTWLLPIHSVAKIIHPGTRTITLCGGHVALSDEIVVKQLFVGPQHGRKNIRSDGPRSTVERRIYSRLRILRACPRSNRFCPKKREDDCRHHQGADCNFPCHCCHRFSNSGKDPPSRLLSRLSLWFFFVPFFSFQIEVIMDDAIQSVISYYTMACAS